MLRIVLYNLHMLQLMMNTNQQQETVLGVQHLLPNIHQLIEQLQVKELCSFNCSSEKHQLVNETEELKKKLKKKDQKEKLYLRSLGCIDLCTTNIDLTKEN